MDWLRLKYQILSILYPAAWVRKSETFNKEWDTKLWNLLLASDIRCVGRFKADIGGYNVWIENFPYASGSVCLSGWNGAYLKDTKEMTCSRATAMFLHHQLKAARLLDRLRFTDEDHRFYFERRIMKCKLEE